MTTWHPGDVVLVPIGFTDRSGSKLRPAVVVSRDLYNAASPDVMIASITGNLRAIWHPGNHLIADWQDVGLLRPSRARAKIAIVESSLGARRLGALSVADLAAVERGLRHALALP